MYEYDDDWNVRRARALCVVNVKLHKTNIGCVTCNDTGVIYCRFEHIARVARLVVTAQLLCYKLIILILLLYDMWMCVSRRLESSFHSRTTRCTRLHWSLGAGVCCVR